MKKNRILILLLLVVSFLIGCEFFPTGTPTLPLTTTDHLPTTLLTSSQTDVVTTHPTLTSDVTTLSPTTQMTSESTEPTTHLPTTAQPSTMIPTTSVTPTTSTTTEPRLYELTLMFNGEPTGHVISLYPGQPLSLPDPIHGLGLIEDSPTTVFHGWYFTSDFNPSSKFTHSVMPAGDFHLYPLITTTEVSVTMFLGTENLGTLTGLPGAPLPLPNIANAYVTFYGWYTAPGFNSSTRFTANTYPLTDTILYASAQVQVFGLTFIIPEYVTLRSLHAGSLEQIAAILDDGRLISTGYVDDSGHGNAGYIQLPALYPGEEITFYQVSDHHVILGTSLNNVYAWGNNVYGQVGAGSQEVVSIPYNLTGSFGFSEGEDIKGIYSTNDTSYLLTTQGRLFAWGYNAQGQIGDNTQINVTTPKEITPFFNLSDGDKIVHFAASSRTIAATTQLKKVYQWGPNINSRQPFDITYRFSLNSSETVTHLQVAINNISLTTSENRVLTNGVNWYGLIGNGVKGLYETQNAIAITLPLIPGETIAHYQITAKAACVITSLQRVFAWGEAISLTPLNLSHEISLVSGEVIDSLIVQEQAIILLTSHHRLMVRGDIDDTSYPAFMPYAIKAATVYSSDKYRYGFAISAPESIPGHQLQGWYLDAALTIPATLPNTMPAQNLQYFAKTVQQDQEIQVLLYEDQPLSFSSIVHRNGTLMFALTQEGDVFVWGDNTTGEYTTTPHYGAPLPTNITHVFNLDPEDRIIKITENGPLIFLAESGRIYSIGFPIDYYRTNTSTNTKYQITEITNHVVLEAEETITDVFAFQRSSFSSGLTNYPAQYTVVVVTSDERILIAGTIDYAVAYKQGSTTLWTPFLSHEQFVDMTDFFNLAEGEKILFMNRGIIYTNFGHVYAWGTEFNGRILDGAQRPSPVELSSRLALLEDETIIDISVRNTWDLNKIHVLTSTGRVLSLVHYTVDGNYNRAYNALVEDLTPMYPLEDGEMITDIDFYQQNYVLTNLGRVFAHGSSSSSFYLGSNDTYTYTTPIDISLLVNLDGSQFQKLLITDRNGFLLTDDGRIYAFGSNANRSLGNGTTLPVLAPKEMTFRGSIFSQSYDFADFIDLPEPSQIGKVFHGYFLDSHFSSPFNPENMPLGSISLYPNWETLYYELAYNTMGGLTINMDHYHYHERMEDIKTPIRFGYTFAGWYLDDQMTQPFDYIRMPACGVTLYAKWMINDYVIEFYDRESVTFEKIYTGEYRTIGITTSGKILMWGDRYGTENQDYFDFYEPMDITDMLDLEPGETIVDCSVSFDHMVFLSSLGDVYAYGSNRFGQTAGRSGKLTDLLSLEAGDQVIKIQTAAYVTYVLSESGNLYAFGAQYLGRLGTGSPSHLTTPTNITAYFPLEAGETIIDISASYTHTLALTSNGRLFFCGGRTVVSGSGMTQVIQTLSQDNPMDITANLQLQPGEQPLMMSTGDFFTIVLTTNDRVLTLGYGPDGELGSDSIYNGNAVDITALFSFLPGETPIEIASGDNHTLLKTSSGRSFSWGLGIVGSTGHGSLSNRTTPYNLSRQLNLLEGESVKEICAGAFASFIITTYGRTLVFGDNLLNELGFSKHESTPLNVSDVFPSLEKGEYYIDIATGIYHGVALTNLGKVFTWGDSSWGQSGSNFVGPAYSFASDLPSFSSREITSRFNLNPGEKVIAIEAGALFSSALTSSGRFFTWGNNSDGELGLSIFAYDYLALPRDITSRFGLEDGEVIVDFKSAYTLTYVRTSLGKTYVFGSTQTSIIDSPMRVNPISPEPDGQITDLAMSPWTFFFRTADGRLFGSGHNLYGTLGNTTNIGKDLSSHSLDFPMLLDEETILKVYTGNYSTLIQTSMGRIFTFGLNQCGQLGLGTTSPVVTEPIEITDSMNLDSNDEITDVVFGGRIGFDNGGFMVIATKMGRVFVSGSNDRNTLLLDGSNQSSVLIDVSHQFAFAPGDYIVQLEASESSVLARTFMGHMLAWGARDQHDFDALKEIGYTPMDVGALPLEAGDDIIEVVAGIAGTAAITQDGRLLYAGTNSFGLADPTNPDWIRRFTDITDRYGLHQDEKILKVALGNAFIVIYTSEGRVLTSGRYYAFEENDPINIEGAVDLSSYIVLDPDDAIIDVMANYRTAAIRTLKGRIFMWGANDGRYGNGTLSSSSVPLEIDYTSVLLSEETIDKIALGYDHTLILTSQHRVLSTGINAGYQLGDGTSITTNVPIDITSRFDYLEDEFIIDIHGGYRYSVALSSEDRLFEWGTRGNYNYSFDQSKPSLVPDFLSLLGSDSISSYSFGGAHGFIMTSSGKIIGFGHNTMNQIGYVNNADSKAVDVTHQFRMREGESLRMVVAGFQHSIAVTSDNRLLTWGNNENSELGNGFAVVYPAPVPIEITIHVKSASEYITYGSPISELPTPEKEGHTFLFWAYDKEGFVPLNTITMPANDIMVYAIWETNAYQITLNVLGETTVLDPLEFGLVIRLNDPILETGTFGGWYLDSEWHIPLTEYFMPAEHLTLYAKVDLP